MKKLLALLLLGVGLIASPASADNQRVIKSSFTTTNDTGYIAASMFVGVDVGAVSSQGCLKVYNSTYTTSVQVSSVTLGTVGNHYYGDNGVSVSGIYYSTTGNANGVTIFYRK